MHLFHNAFRRFLLAFLAIFVASPGAFASESYATNGNCDGFPRLPLTTAPGLCVGLVASNLGFARGVVTLGSYVYVADMGGWQKGKGRLLRLTLSKPGAPDVLLKNLDEPNSLTLSGHGTIYMGVLGKVVEFDPRISDPSKAMRDVVVGLPDEGRHPLPAFALAADGSIYINVGSGTDNCERQDGKQGPAQIPCPETTGPLPRGAIIHIMPKPGGPVDAKNAKVVAKGLRNSMALAVLPDGQLVAATNSRDAIDQADPKLSDEDLPHDTLDWIEKGADYGWPYCFDANRPSPEYAAFDCSGRHLHTRLLPPHAAPLGMLYYKTGPLPGLPGNVIIAYHGYRALGHRIVKLAVDASRQGSAADGVACCGFPATRWQHPLDGRS